MSDDCIFSHLNPERRTKASRGKRTGSVVQKASVTVGLTVMTFLTNLRDFEGNFTQVTESSTRLLTSRQLPLFYGFCFKWCSCLPKRLIKWLLCTFCAGCFFVETILWTELCCLSRLLPPDLHPLSPPPNCSFDSSSSSTFPIPITHQILPASSFSIFVEIRIDSFLY